MQILVSIGSIVKAGSWPLLNINAMHKGDIINYGSRGSTKLGKFFCVFSLIPPHEGGAQTDDPPYLAGLKTAKSDNKVIRSCNCYRGKVNKLHDFCIWAFYTWIGILLNVFRCSHEMESMQRSCENFEPMVLHQINFMIPPWWWFVDPPINGTWNWVIPPKIRSQNWVIPPTDSVDPRLP